MNRKHEIVLVAHCILNGNAKVEGLSVYEGTHERLLDYLIKKGYGLMQMPCPEMQVFGCKRWGHVVEQLDTPHFRKYCRKLIAPLVDQLVDYSKNGYIIKALIGIDLSPSCGVNTTPSSENWGGEFGVKPDLKPESQLSYVNGQGILVQELRSLLDEHNLKIPFLAIDENDKEFNLEKFKGVV
jgi:predicted secreted protein